MQISVIGTGFVGVVTSGVFASFGHKVFGLDIDKQKIASLKKGKVPFFEPNLTELVVEQQKMGNLSFTTSYKDAIPQSDLIMIAVGTPAAPDGQADLKFVLAAAQETAKYLKNGAIVAIKSTVPPGSFAKISQAMLEVTKNEFHLVSLPEFLREGTAVKDTLQPDRVVIGTKNNQVFATLADLHKPLNAPTFQVSPESAQMAKYTANAYLATRITFINQIADLCEFNNADIQEVISVIGQDKRIGTHYWYPGFGYGGSCFPKDVKEVAAYSRSVGESDNIFNKINDLNDNRIEKLLQRYNKQVNGFKNKKVAVLGLSFKPNTDDMREAPSLKVIPYLLTSEATVVAFDPRAIEVAKQVIASHNNLSFAPNIAEACLDADIIIALTEWPQIVSFDFGQLPQPNRPRWFIDARNQFDIDDVKAWGFKYIGIGRGNQ